MAILKVKANRRLVFLALLLLLSLLLLIAKDGVKNVASCRLFGEKKAEMLKNMLSLHLANKFQVAKEAIYSAIRLAKRSCFGSANESRSTNGPRECINGIVIFFFFLSSSKTF